MSDEKTVYLPPQRLQLDEFTISEIERWIQLGLDYHSACLALRINKHTADNWLRSGKANPDSLYGELLFRVSKSVVILEGYMLKVLKDGLESAPAEYKQYLLSEVVHPDGTIERKYRHLRVREERKPDANIAKWFMSRRFRSKWGDNINLNLPGMTFSDPLNEPDKEKLVPENKLTEKEHLEQLIHLGEQAKMIVEHGMGEDDEKPRE